MRRPVLNLELVLGRRLARHPRTSVYPARRNSIGQPNERTNARSKCKDHCQSVPERVPSPQGGALRWTTRGYPCYRKGSGQEWDARGCVRILEIEFICVENDLFCHVTRTSLCHIRTSLKAEYMVARRRHAHHTAIIRLLAEAIV